MTQPMVIFMAKVSEMMQQLVSYMMGKGDVSLAGTIHDNLYRVMVTAKEDLASILPHRWVEPVTIPLVY